MTLIRNAQALVCLGFALLVGGCETTPEAPQSVEFHDEESIEATIVSIDVENRMATLVEPGEEPVTIHIPPEARNLEQVEEGDTLRISYTSAYRASLAAPGETESGLVVGAGRAPEGERPGAVVGAGIVTSIEIISVAEDGSSVSFRDESGVLDSMQVLREEGQEFAKGLKQGDVVILEHTESVAVEVEDSAATSP